LGLAACGGGTAADPPDGGLADSGAADAGPARFAQVEQHVIKISCALSASCHGATPGQGKLDLSGNIYDALVNVPSTEVPGKMRVVPGDPDSSYVMDKLLNRNLPVGPDPTSPWTFMPTTGMIEPERIEQVRSWIADGAKNN
jgi:hypothetical protein